jgi:hypothetical protein
MAYAAPACLVVGQAGVQLYLDCGALQRGMLTLGRCSSCSIRPACLHARDDALVLSAAASVLHTLRALASMLSLAVAAAAAAAAAAAPYGPMRPWLALNMDVAEARTPAMCHCSCAARAHGLAPLEPLGRCAT